MNEMRYTEIAYGAWAGQMVGDALGASVEGWRGANIMARHPQGLATMLPNSPILLPPMTNWIPQVFVTSRNKRLNRMD